MLVQPAAPDLRVADESLDCEVVVTRGGARAMRDRLTGEVMHPIVGPRAEAESLYVDASRLRDRLLTFEPKPLCLFDVGLGAGSNAIAAWQLSEALDDSARQLEIVSFDQSLAALVCALEPAHREAFGLDGPAGEAARSLVGEGRHSTRRTHWRLQLGALPETLLREPAGVADIVFWDPFSPSANPKLWSYYAFRTLYERSGPHVSLHTYSGATAIRSALLLAGFAVGEGEPTPSGKRTTRAARDVKELIRPLDRRWLARLSRSSAGLPSDAPANAIESIRMAPQFAE
ncbi:MAG TPA: MnmC family methyltransferase [Polyangiaceae bacterium]